MRPVVRSSPWRTSGSQKWMGASPTLSERASRVMVAGAGWESWRISHSPVSQALVKPANRITAAAVA